MASTTLTATCHCGAVEIALPRKPTVLTRCNCSYCNRTDPLFAYYRRRTIDVRPGLSSLTGYTWGRGVLQWFRCRRCGCFTHHAPRGHRGPEARLGINMRLVTPNVLQGTTVKLRDGANDTWRVLDAYPL